MSVARSYVHSMAEAVRETIGRLGADGFVAYPTETVWGLGACVDRPRAIERLMDWKGRPSDAPLAVLVPEPETATAIGCALDDPIRRLMAAFWPGPLMVVVPCRETWASGVARSDGALGLRCSSHPLASALARGLLEAGCAPLTSTSLNRSGEAPARDLEETMRSLAVAAPGAPRATLEAPLLISVDGQDAGGDRPSTVVDCTGSDFEILRDGAIARDAIGEVWSG